MKFIRLIVPAMLAIIGCAKEQDRSASLDAQPVAAAEQSETTLATANIASRKEVSAVATHSSVLTDDGAGKLLEELTTSGSPGIRIPLPRKSPRERILPARIAQPEPADVANTLVPVRCPSPALADVRPVALVERASTDFAPLAFVVPERIEFPVAIFTALPAADVTRPVPLPTLARHSVDRGSLEDPTAEFTLQSIVNNKPPLRSLPAPFVKVVLPDPFENAEAVKVKITIKEDPLTAVGNPSPPNR
jgi:hypothetical protein